MERFTDCNWTPMMKLGYLSMVLFWIILITGLIFWGQWLLGHGFTSREDSAFDILKKRYARGEITKQEFDDMKRDILC